MNTPIDTITIKGEDNSGKPVTNKVEGLPEGVTFDSSTNTISGSPSEVGEYPVMVTTTDAEGNHTETTFTITVVDKTAPTVEAIDDQTKEVNTPIDPIIIKGEDNSGKPVTNEVKGLPKGVTFDPETNTISGAPSEVGTYPITVITTDANGNQTETTCIITVTPKDSGKPSTPSNPGEPSTSSNLGEPSAPSETVAPENNVQDTSGIGSTDNSTQDNAGTKDKKENNKHSLPETGGDKSSSTTLIGGILAAIVGIFLLGRRRKKQ